MRAAVSILIALLACSPLLAPAAEPDPADVEHFELKIRPVLAGTCFKCHGGDNTSGQLRVDSRQALLRGGDRGPALVPHDVEASLLIRALRHDADDLQMPPDEPLPPAVVADFATWIKRGAVWPASGPSATDDPFARARHWAFQPLQDPQPPDGASDCAAGAIDQFIAARLRERGLRPAPPADPRTLLRRVYFDLIGLPPPPDEIDAFLADTRPDAFARAVERLLASPRYGERWGRYWMDVVRYADTAGDNADYPIPEMYRYRNYIIDAFNSDKPYDQFVREQLAGDLVAQTAPPEQYAELVTATGFLALSRRYATAPYELWHLSLEDTIDTTGQAFLGLTLRCARCHDHKFDPLTNEDYYALYGIFASTKFPFAGSEEFQSKNFDRMAFVPLEPPDQAAASWETHHAEAQRIETELAELEKDQSTDERKKKIKQLRHELQLMQRPGLPLGVPGAYAVSEGDPVDVPVQLRGDPGQPGEVVSRAVPAFLAGDAPPNMPADASGRLELAAWMTTANHPLTARVIVNRIWQHHFGTGIVATPSNFGLRGAEPTHPELLDWLTSRFIDSGWSIKTLQRLILASSVYRMSSAFDTDSAAVDPDNRYLWRFPRRRLDAEAIRDALLAVSGNLDETRPGPHPFPPIDQWHWTQHDPFKAVYPSQHRSVYLMTQRLQRHPYLALFDGPDTNTTSGTRTSSTVPLQALFWMNNDFVQECSQRFAQRLMNDSDNPAQRIVAAHRLAYSRDPTVDELERGLAYIDQYANGLRRAGVVEDEVEHEAWLSYARTILTANEFVYVD
jgi:hypothetical protein